MCSRACLTWPAPPEPPNTWWTRCLIETAPSLVDNTPSLVERTPKHPSAVAESVPPLVPCEDVHSGADKSDMRYALRDGHPREFREGRCTLSAARSLAQTTKRAVADASATLDVRPDLRLRAAADVNSTNSTWSLTVKANGVVSAIRVARPMCRTQRRRQLRARVRSQGWWRLERPICPCTRDSRRTTHTIDTATPKFGRASPALAPCAPARSPGSGRAAGSRGSSAAAAAAASATAAAGSTSAAASPPAGARPRGFRRVDHSAMSTWARRHCGVVVWWAGRGGECDGRRRDRWCGGRCGGWGDGVVLRRGSVVRKVLNATVGW